MMNATDMQVQQYLNDHRNALLYQTQLRQFNIKNYGISKILDSHPVKKKEDDVEVPNSKYFWNWYYRTYPKLDTKGFYKKQPIMEENIIILPIYEVRLLESFQNSEIPKDQLVIYTVIGLLSQESLITDILEATTFKEGSSRGGTMTTVMLT